MSQHPRPESRLRSLEKRASTLEAALEELSSDQAEELKAIRQEIKQLSEGITASYVSIGDTFMATWADTKVTLATKDDISKLEARLDTMASKDDISRLEGLIKRLLQQKSGE